jgi:hypothetical protein
MTQAAITEYNFYSRRSVSPSSSSFFITIFAPQSCAIKTLLQSGRTVRVLLNKLCVCHNGLYLQHGTRVNITDSTLGYSNTEIAMTFYPWLLPTSLSGPAAVSCVSSEHLRRAGTFWGFPHVHFLRNDLGKYNSYCNIMYFYFPLHLFA